MKTIGIRELRANLTDHVRAAGRGEVICIACHSRPIAMLVATGSSVRSMAPEMPVQSEDPSPDISEAAIAPTQTETVLITVKGYTLKPLPEYTGELPLVALNVRAESGQEWHFPLKNFWFNAQGRFCPANEHREFPVLPEVQASMLTQRGIAGLVGHTFRVCKSVYTDSWAVFSKLSHPGLVSHE